MKRVNISLWFASKWNVNETTLQHSYIFLSHFMVFHNKSYSYASSMGLVNDNKNVTAMCFITAHLVLNDLE